MEKGTDKSAPFNMAIDTLERLGDILREIKISSAMKIEDPLISQSVKMDLTKQFFLNAIPLLEDETIKKFKEKVLKLELVEMDTYPYRNSNSMGPIIRREVYNSKLDDTLNNILLELQLELQKNKFFMPSKSDPKYGWGLGD